MPESHLLQHIEEVICSTADDFTSPKEQATRHGIFPFLQLPTEIRLSIYDSCSPASLRTLRYVNIQIRRECDPAFFAKVVYTMDWEIDYFLPYDCGHLKMTRHRDNRDLEGNPLKNTKFDLHQLRPIHLDALSKVRHLAITSHQNGAWNDLKIPVRVCNMLPRLQSLACIEFKQNRGRPWFLSLYKLGDGQVQREIGYKGEKKLITYTPHLKRTFIRIINVMRPGMEFHVIRCNEEEKEQLQASAEPVPKLLPIIRDTWHYYANGEADFGPLNAESDAAQPTSMNMPDAVRERRARLRAKLYPEVDTGFKNQLDEFLANVAKHSTSPASSFSKQVVTPTAQQVIDMLVRGDRYCVSGRYYLRPT